MNQAELEALTKLVAEQVLQTLQTKAPSPCEEGKKKLLVIGKQDRVPEKFRTDTVLYTIEDYAEHQNILRYSGVILTGLTLTQLADLALGRADTPETCAVTHALLENVDVCMTESALPHRKYAGKQNAALYHLYESYVQKLQIYGVKLLTNRVIPEPAPAKPAKYAAAPISAPEGTGVRNLERVVTEAMAVKLTGEGTVHLRKDAIVTPAAADVFTKLGTAVIRDL